jgi:hypothetical protein
MFRFFEIRNRKIRANDVKKQTMFGFLLFDKKVIFKKTLLRKKVGM